MGSGGSVEAVATATETLTSTVTTRLPMPIAGQMPLTAIAIGMDDNNNTIFAATDCSTAASTCVFVNPVTFTAAPGTYFFNGTGHWTILGELDCAITGSPQTAACAWTVGRYPKAELANLRNSWITTPAPNSATILPTVTDATTHDAQAFVDVVYTQTGYSTLYSSASPARGAGLGVKLAMVAVVISVTSAITLF